MSIKILSFFVTLLVFISATRRAFSEDAPKVATISSDKLSQMSVIGLLGVPLGTIVEINAVIISGNELKTKADQSAYLLRVDSVNGVAVSKVTIIHFGVPVFASVRLADNQFSLFELKNHRKAGFTES